MVRKKKKKSIGTFRKTHSKSNLKWFLLLSFTIIILVFFPGSHGTLQLIKLKIKEHKLLKQKKELQEQNLSLKNQRDSLSTDSKAIEKIAREKYNMVKKGEDIYQIVPKK